jgi:hypothetical protein
MKHLDPKQILGIQVYGRVWQGLIIQENLIKVIIIRRWISIYTNHIFMILVSLVELDRLNFGKFLSKI